MPEELNREERVVALRAHPLAQNSMNSAKMGALGLTLDIAIEPGWVGIIEELFGKITELQPEHWPMIAQIKEKFAGLRVYCDQITDDVQARRHIKDAIAYAEGRAARTCQVCGCRGRLRKNQRWWVTACKPHHEASATVRRLNDLPGADDAVANYSLATVKYLGTHRDLPALVFADLYTGQVREVDGSLAYLAGVFESESLLVAIDPASLGEVIPGPLSAPIHSAAEAFAEIASKHGRDPTQLELWLREAHCGQERHEVLYLSKIWRWVAGLDQLRELPSEDEEEDDHDGA